MKQEERTFKPWTGKQPPKRILAIRLQALGDTFIAISYLQYLRQHLPAGTKIDLLVRREFYDLPSSLELFDEVFCLKGGNGLKKQAICLLPHLLKIKLNNYDVVLDLQNNQVSGLVRRFVNPSAYVRFDRFSNKHACVRNIETINKAGIMEIKEGTGFKLKQPDRGRIILRDSGWNGEQLILLNPAGAYENRNWPVENYIRLAQLLKEKFGASIKFLLLGDGRIHLKAQQIKQALGDNAIVLVNKTSIADAFAIVQELTLSVTEDGALMHMSYLSGKYTIGLLGSSRSDWHDPKMPHTFSFTSDDMECGNCMLPVCKYHTNACMTRVTPEQVFEKAVSFLNKTRA